MEWPEWSGVFYNVVHQRASQRSRRDGIPEEQSNGSSKCSNMGIGIQLTIILSCLDILCEKCGRSDNIVNAQFKEIHNHPPIRQDDSTSIVKFANVFTNVVNTLTKFGYRSDLEEEAGLSSITRKFSPQLREQWLKYLKDRRLLSGN